MGLAVLMVYWKYVKAIIKDKIMNDADSDFIILWLNNACMCNRHFLNVAFLLKTLDSTSSRIVPQVLGEINSRIKSLTSWATFFEKYSTLKAVPWQKGMINQYGGKLEHIYVLLPAWS